MAKDKTEPETVCGNELPDETPVFAQTTGAVLVVVGFVLSFGGCCFWSVSGLAQEELAAAPASLGEWLRAGSLVQVLTALGTVAACVGGMAMLAAGMGMVARRAWSGIGGMVVTGLFGLIWTASLVVHVRRYESPSSLIAIGISLVIAVGSAVLFLLCGAAHQDLRRHPRPADYNAVPPDANQLYASARDIPPEEDWNDS